MRIRIYLILVCLSSLTVNAQSPKYEFRGIWITTVNNLDWPSSEKLTSLEQQKEFLTILDTIKAYNLNAVFVQIRAAGDAFYPSTIEPWSVWLTGQQGKAPEPYYDPLAFMIHACHERNIEFHAWFNLVRGVNHMRFFPPSKNHIYSKKPEWFFDIGERRFFNQGIPDVRDYTVKVILDVVKRYPQLDGVHLDDYFYPEEIRKKEISDLETFNQFNNNFTDIEDWRRHNIDTLIYTLSDSIRKTNPYIKFGVSPISVWRHKKFDPEGSETDYSLCAYDHLSADTKKWIEKGWIDYIIPQNYGNTASKIANHETIANWWGNLRTNHHRYIGNALYKWSADSWIEWKRLNEIPLQIEIQRNHTGLKGNSLFRYQALTSLPLTFRKSLKMIYNQPALTPIMEWKCNDTLPETPYDLTYHWENETLTLNIHSSNRKDKFLVYAFSKNETLNISNFDNLSQILHQGESSILLNNEITSILITTIDSCNRESEDFYGISKTKKKAKNKHFKL